MINGGELYCGGLHPIGLVVPFGIHVPFLAANHDMYSVLKGVTKKVILYSVIEAKRGKGKPYCIAVATVVILRKHKTGSLAAGSMVDVSP